MPDATLVPNGVTRIRANNPSPLTLDGTNTYLVERWVVDPGPSDPAHLDAIVAAAASGIEGIVLTHSHSDHSEAAPALAERVGAPVVQPRGGEQVGPFSVISTPGHAHDHVSLLWRRVLFAGDMVLGEGSVFVGGEEGSMWRTSTRCGGCARSSSRRSARDTGRWCGTRARSSRSTRRTGSSASGGCSTRSRRAC